MTSLEQHLTDHAQSTRYVDGVPRCACKCGQWIASIVERSPVKAHRAHVANAWRESRTVRTVEELDDLGREAIVMWINPDGSVHGAHTYPDNRMLRQIMIETDTTALILWTPEDGAL